MFAVLRQFADFKASAGTSKLWNECGGDDGDSNIDPTIDPPAMYDMSEQWHHPDWSQPYPDGAGF
eukprot:CAMPEP_0173422522 /NCGR_PEP_ID=MMETSP1357-20121228/3199_1 /TAXON_ID=77926 /ORGANISM="Hemiselmis rufescens, Strain PCC563" /LENGTH=64 /DNA_ID=CAMNT_0014385557 /DNA_START=20 /DNA_END=214 /DNA_ORIENTATION=-